VDQACYSSATPVGTKYIKLSLC